MLNSRDSSIWRSLAVAFGDGVAFGVGVKLTQPPPARSVGPAPRIDLSPLAQRIREIEQKVDALHQMPRAIAPAAAGASFDQKVLEAVVNALDARLNEQAGQVERRLTELEAKLAIELKELDRQDQSIVTGTQGRLEEIQGMVQQEIVGVRNEMAALRGRVDEDMASLPERMAAMQHELGVVLERMIEEQVAAQVDTQMIARLPAMEQVLRTLVSSTLNMQLRPLEQQMREEVRHTAGRAASLLVSSMEATVDEKMFPIRADLEEKGREIAELRHKVGEADRSVLDLILAIGVMCRQAADRIGPSAEQAATVMAEAPAAVEEARVADAQTPSTEIHPLPGFAQESQPGKLWKIPLVSSFMLATCGLLLLHYL
jgi:hypothetical protein